MAIGCQKPLSLCGQIIRLNNQAANKLRVQNTTLVTQMTNCLTVAMVLPPISLLSYQLGKAQSEVDIKGLEKHGLE